MKELIKLTDGALINIKYDCDCSSGCPTCGYGSNYVNEYAFHFSNNEKLEIKVNNMYHYFFSEGDMMYIILPNLDHIKTLSKKEFCDWIVDNVRHTKKDGYELPDEVYAYYYSDNGVYSYDDEEEE